MPKNALRSLLDAAAGLGLRTLVQSGLQPWRRSYRLARAESRGRHWPAFWRAWAKASRARPPDWDSLHWTYAGDLDSYERRGRYLTLQCRNAAIRLAILAPDLVQVRLRPDLHKVRLRPDGEFPPPFSYAVCKPEEEWPEVPFEVTESAEGLEVRTPALCIRISRRPCRIAFLDPNGQEVHADAEGLGWCGEAVAAGKALAADEHIYGLGEKACGMDLRGGRFEMWNTDPRTYGPGDDPLYTNIPFYLGLRGVLGYGVLFDNSHRSRFDLGAGEAGRLRFEAFGEMRYYFFYGPALRTVLERYTELTGRMPLPPLWSLGYHQSRWSYYPEAQVRELARQFRARRIPCDAIHLDIHYMHGYRVFSWDPQRFPDPAGLVAGLRQEGFKTVVIIDPAIKADEQYEPFREGLEEGYFLRYPDGTVFKGPVWPGDACFPDFTSPRVRAWWAGLCRRLWEGTGVAGIWGDMNEPAVFGPGRGETVPDAVLHDLEGKGGTHAEAHNVYGMQMVRAMRAGCEAGARRERPLVITRAGFAGVQRYAALWTGDNQSTWEHLRLTLPMLLGLGLSGLSFTGCDTGGFAGDCGGEMLVRWTQLTALTPYCRNHSALGTAPQEPWAFGEPYESLIRAAIELRYRLLLCLYTAFWQSVERGLPIIRPLLLDFQEDAATHALDDQFLLGDSLLVAPVGRPGATTRPVYLPAGAWYSLDGKRRFEGPATITVDAPLSELPVFARGGSVVSTWPLQQYTGERPLEALTLHLYPGTGTSWLYEDDGRTLDYQQGLRRVTRFMLEEGAGCLRLMREAEGSYRPEYGEFRLVLHGVDGPRAVLVDGAPATDLSYSDEAQTLEVGVKEFHQIEFCRA